MEAINDLFDLAAEWIFGGVVIPIMKAVAAFISLCFTPVSSLSPSLQVTLAAFLGALLSMGLTRLRLGKGRKKSRKAV